MADVKIFRNKDASRPKNPPSEDQAKEAMTEVGGTNVTAETGKEPKKGNYTKVTFTPPSTGHYKTEYPNELAKVVKDRSNAQSWDFVWG